VTRRPLKVRIPLVLIAALSAIITTACSKGNVNSNAEGFSVLEIVNADSGRVYDRRLIETGGEFSIEFIHSVNQSPVRETFIIESGMIKPAAVRFYSFGAGMLSDMEEGMTMSRDGDAFVITGFNRQVKELNYIVGTVSNHMFLINDDSISLKDLCGRNAHITFRTGEIK